MSLGGVHCAGLTSPPDAMNALRRRISKATKKHPAPGAFLLPVIPPPKCGVAKQCGVKQCVAKMWRHREMWLHQKMWRQNVASQDMWLHQKMWRQTVRRQNVASQGNVASSENVASENAAPQCGVTGQCGVTRTLWRQTMWRHLSSKCVFEMCLQRQVEKWIPFCQHCDEKSTIF